MNVNSTFKKNVMKSLFTPEVHQEVQDRIQKLEASSQPTWGKMDVAQMCTHCQAPLEVAMQKTTLGDKKIGFFMFCLATVLM